MEHVLHVVCWMIAAFVGGGVVTFFGCCWAHGESKTTESEAMGIMLICTVVAVGCAALTGAFMFR